MLFNTKNLNPDYYQPSGHNDTFDFTGVDFNDYITHMRQKIFTSRLDLRTDYPEKIIEANVPFAWLPQKTPDKKRGVLLIHGLYDSPFSLRDLGHIFYQQGFYVYAILLPGHGTRPGDLLTIQHQSWQQAVDFGVDTLKNTVDEIYLCGFSTGGLLCLDYHLRNPTVPIQGLITLAPPIKIKNFFAPLAPSIAKVYPWVEKQVENNYAKYRSFAARPVAEVYHLSNAVWQKSKLSKHLNTDLLITFSKADHIISASACERYFSQYASPNSRCLIYHTDLSERKQDPRIEYTDNVFSGHTPNILQHNGLPFSVANTHYGQNGDYHEKDELLYNPGFDVLTKTVLEFLDR